MPHTYVVSILLSLLRDFSVLGLEHLFPEYYGEIKAWKWTGIIKNLQTHKLSLVHSFTYELDHALSQGFARSSGNIWSCTQYCPCRVYSQVRNTSVRKIILSCQLDPCTMGSTSCTQELATWSEEWMNQDRDGFWALLWIKLGDQRRNLSFESKGFIHFAIVDTLAFLVQMWL